MKPGKVKREKLITGMKKGILVTRFHYLNGSVSYTHLTLPTN